MHRKHKNNLSYVGPERRAQCREKSVSLNSVAVEQIMQQQIENVEIVGSIEYAFQALAQSRAALIRMRLSQKATASMLDYSGARDRRAA